MVKHNSGMRIGYIVKRYPRYSETFVVNEILAHEKAGFEIEIFSLRPPEDGHFQDILAKVRAKVNYLPYTGVKALNLWAAIEEASKIYPDICSALNKAQGENYIDIYQAILFAKVARLKGVQHIHAHFASSATTVARLASLFSGLPYTFTAHAKDIYHESTESTDFQRKLNDAAAVVTVSDYNCQYLLQNYNTDSTQIIHIYNGLNLEYFSFVSPSIRRPLIVAVGRLVEKKGFGSLIDACDILKKRGIHFCCQIIGTGVLEAELRAKIERLRLGDTIEMLGPRPQQEIMRHIQSAAVFAVPCVVGSDGDRDGLPTVLLEAMALGTPCVSTDVTGIPEIIHNNETGLMVPQNDPLMLARALERLLNNSELRVKLACQARRLVESEFNIHKNSRHLRELFFLQKEQNKNQQWRNFYAYCVCVR